MSEEAWERAVAAALKGKTEPPRALTLDCAVKCASGRLPPPSFFEGRLAALEHLSVANVRLSSLEGFPCLPALRRLVLSDNRIVGGLHALVDARLDALRDLDLSNNRIASVEDLAPLAKLRLESLDLYECPVTKIEGYRSKRRARGGFQIPARFRQPLTSSLSDRKEAGRRPARLGRAMESSSHLFLPDRPEGDDDHHADTDDGDNEAADERGAEAAESYDDVQYLVRRNRAAARKRLLARIKLIHYEIHKPLADTVRDHVLFLLPASSILRLRAVSRSWARHVSSPIFAHTQSRAHRSIAGVFFGSSDDASVAYVPFPPAAAHFLPDPALSFFPASPIAVCSSSNGLLLCYAPSSGDFFVCNPATGAWTTVPRPPRNPGLEPAAVLIFVPGVYNFRSDYTIVVGFMISGAGSGIFGFQTFSSSAGGWWVSNAVCAAECLFPDSGISAGGVAFWRTTMLTVVGYDPAEDSVRVAHWPMNYAVEARWEIGQMGDGGRLFCTAVTEEVVQVHKLLPKSDQWALVASMDLKKRSNTDSEEEEEEEEAWEVEAGGQLVFRKRPWPMRFQGGELEVLLWVEGRVVGVDLGSKRVRVAAAFGWPTWADGRGAKYVPYISTLAEVPPSAAAALASSIATPSPQVR
ncbi:hypothetical protein BHE74_00044598 [Ensete ventricosum]|nr:hypothetical protein BHE74_00044598 [Ensete ventricosum]